MLKPYSEYESILEVLEDQIDIKVVEDFHAGQEEVFPMEVVQKIAAGTSSVKVFRELRGISLTE
jgi:hypothetical protein